MSPRRNLTLDGALTLDRATLQKLLAHASSAARLIGYIDGGANGASFVDRLSEHIDAIVHELSELLGNPHLIAANALSTVTSGVVTRDVVGTHGRQHQRVEKVPATIDTKAEPTKARRRLMRKDARSAMWWICGATVAGLFMLVELVLRVLGFGGGAR